MHKILNYKKAIFFAIALAVAIGIFIYIGVNAAVQSSGIDAFPNSYKPYLQELSKKHPNWKFTALYTNLDWNYVIDQENVFGKNLVPKNYSDSWKNTTPGQYNVEVDAGWVDSSKQAVEYCMDPRNFLNEVRIFQFEALSFDSHTNNLNSIEKILYGTEFYQRQVSYLDSSGNNHTMNATYADLILKAGKTSLVSPYHLASRIKQEVGPFLSHASISGTVDGFKGLYNFYNIGATSSSEPMGAIKNGLQYAKDGKGASQATKDKYFIPWNNKEKAITGGGIFIGSSYINVGQDTIYLQKFDVVDYKNDGLFWHQYMTNVLAPYSEAKSIYNGYQKSGLLEIPMTFIIPVFNNMPEIPTQSPSIKASDFLADNTRVYCNAQNVNIRTGPSTSYEIITTAQKQQKMTRIKKGNQSGDRWDMVKLENGIIGYIFQTYITEDTSEPEDTVQPPEEAPDNQVPENETGGNSNGNLTDENLPDGNPEDGSDGDLPEETPDDETGEEVPEQEPPTIPEGVDISFSDQITVSGTEISGIKYNENTVADIKQNIITSLEIEVVNNKGEILKDTDMLGTGYKVRIKEGENILIEYSIIIYGDVNGDSKVNSVDLLVLQRHILEIAKLEPIYQKAANVRKTATKPTSVDLLLIQRHILGLQQIVQ